VSLLLALPMIILKVHLKISWLGFAGLSYVTFRTIQIYIDRQPDEKPIHPRDYFTFLVFTPTLLIGPIDRWHRFRNNLDEGYRNLNSTLFFEGWQNVTLGILQKFVLAEIVSRYWLQPEDQVYTFLQHINAAFAYTTFLYFDFAGYSSLAVGFGNMLGIKVPHNFNQPYLAQNPQDFWRRWHITLGDWLRDYFFKPIYKWLSGFRSLKKYPVSKQNAALFFTFVLMGCWNGFEHNYILSGVVFGLYSAIHNTYIMQCKKRDKDIVFGKINPNTTRILSISIMICAAVFAIYIFSGRSGL
jgi:membrane protein involved in D-alanine export